MSSRIEYLIPVHSIILLIWRTKSKSLAGFNTI